MQAFPMPELRRHVLFESCTEHRTFGTLYDAYGMSSYQHRYLHPSCKDTGLFKHEMDTRPLNRLYELDVDQAPSKSHPVCLTGRTPEDVIMARSMTCSRTRAASERLESTRSGQVSTVGELSTRLYLKFLFNSKSTSTLNPSSRWTLSPTHCEALGVADFAIPRHWTNIASIQIARGAISVLSR
jgi:hypothetical protein